MPTPTQTLQWIRPPRQARTQETLERLLDAAEALLSEKRFEDVHVAEVARRAGTSVAAFYRRFKDKEGLLHALHERLCEEAFATADDALDPERWAGAEIREILETVVPFLIAVFEERQALDLAVYQRGLTDEAMRERSHRLSRYALDRLSALLLARREEIAHPKAERAVSFALMQTAAILNHLYTARFREAGLARMSNEEIATETVRSCLAYLGARESASQHATARHSTGELA